MKGRQAVSIANICLNSLNQYFSDTISSSCNLLLMLSVRTTLRIYTQVLLKLGIDHMLRVPVIHKKKVKVT